MLCWRDVAAVRDYHEGRPMGVLAWIVIGLVAGWLAARITDSPRGLLRNLAVGLLGAVLGGFLFTKLGVPVVPDFWGALITAVIGAVLLLVILQALRRA
jgi:uncharacterized membrane protein YeaQ/YmgE (transglycosylase-associated protein family)